MTLFFVIHWPPCFHVNTGLPFARNKYFGVRVTIEKRVHCACNRSKSSMFWEHSNLGIAIDFGPQPGFNRLQPPVTRPPAGGRAGVTSQLHPHPTATTTDHADAPVIPTPSVAEAGLCTVHMQIMRNSTSPCSAAALYAYICHIPKS